MSDRELRNMSMSVAEKYYGYRKNFGIDHRTTLEFILADLDIYTPPQEEVQHVNCRSSILPPARKTRKIKKG